MHPPKVKHRRAPLGQYVATAPAERVHHVFLRMSVSREIDPLTPAALLAVVSKSLLEPHAPRVNRQAALVQQQLDGVKPVQDLVGRPPPDDTPKTC